jgi:hypothetical protein
VLVRNEQNAGDKKVGAMPNEWPLTLSVAKAVILQPVRSGRRSMSAVHLHCPEAGSPLLHPKRLLERELLLRLN